VDVRVQVEGNKDDDLKRLALFNFLPYTTLFFQIIAAPIGLKG